MIYLQTNDATLSAPYDKIQAKGFKIHSVMFDPPFFFDKQSYKQIRDKNLQNLKPIIAPATDEYLRFWDAICRNCVDLIDPRGWFMFKADLRTILKVHDTTCQYFDFVNEIIWDKKRIGLGHYTRKQHEFIIIYRPKGAKNSHTLQRLKPKGLKSSSHGKSKGKAFSSILRILAPNGGEFGQGNNKHINETPLALWNQFINYFVPIGGVVLDPCMGSGSIGKSAKILGRGYCGIEVDEEFFEMARLGINKIKNSELLDHYIEKK